MTLVLVLIAGAYVLVKSGVIDQLIALAGREDSEPTEPDETA
jgi:hypothetical protein